MGNNRTPKCQFAGCNALGTIAVNIDRRGGGHAYLCACHARGERLLPYSHENQLRIGNMKVNGLTYAIENEIDNPTPKAICELGIAGFTGTYDCTVDLEAKSPIYNGANALKAILPQLERLQNNGECSVSSRCGTHLHIGRVDYGRRERDRILPYYWKIHSTIWNAFQAHRSDIDKLFGRREGKWAFGADGAAAWYNRACQIGASGYATTDALDAHPAFLNVQHTCTLEWRQCKFVNAAQYSCCIDFCRALSSAIFDFAQIAEPTERDVKKLCKKLVKIIDTWEYR